MRSHWGFQRLAEPTSNVHASVAEDPALLLLILSDPPLAPNTWVEVRLLGAVAASNSPVSPVTNWDEAGELGAWQERADQVEALARWLAVGIPVVDESLADIYTLASLPERLQVRLEHALGEMETASPRSAPQLSAEQIAALYRAARAQARQQRRASQHARDESETPHERLFSQRADTVGGRFATSLGTNQIFAQASAGEGDGARDGEGVSWQGLAGVGPAEVRARGIAAFAHAEHLLRRVPARFLRYLDELLPANERVLFFADTEAFNVRGWTGKIDASLGAQTQQQERKPERAKSSRWGRALGAVGVGSMRTRTLQAGLLLVTERQVLLLRDLAPPDATLVQWGYIAHSWPLGRLVAARALTPGTDLSRATLVGWPARVTERLTNPILFDEATAPTALARLALALEGSNGTAISGAALPAEGASVIARAEQLLKGFCPWPGTAGAADRRVRAMPEARPWRPTEEEAAALESLGGMVPDEVAQGLVHETKWAISSDEEVLVQARTPELDVSGAGKAALLTLTPTRLLVATMPNQAGVKARLTPELRAIPLHAVTSALLQHSVLGSGLVVYFTQAERQSEISQLSISFPSPLIVPFRALFIRLGALLQLPPIT
ncbi:MAG TPA: hypothetical protein VGF38_06030 [Ktedonobacterales bacterium]